MKGGKRGRYSYVPLLPYTAAESWDKLDAYATKNHNSGLRIGESSNNAGRLALTTGYNHAALIASSRSPVLYAYSTNWRSRPLRRAQFANGPAETDAAVR